MATNDPIRITRAATLVEAFKLIYSNASMMDAWLASAPDLRTRMARARRCSEVASNPAGRYGLDSVPGSVVEVINTHLAACVADERFVRASGYVRKLRARGIEWDTVWATMEGDCGFGPGDSRFFDVA